MTLFRRLATSLATCLVLLLATNCDQQDQEAVAPSLSLTSAEVTELRELLADERVKHVLDQLLPVKPINGNAWHWQPQWQRLLRRGADIAYVSLEPRGDADNDSIPLFNTRRYVYFKRTAGQWQLALLNYCYAPTAASGQTPATTPGTAAFFAAFTGDLIVTALPTGESTHYSYNNGTPQRPVGKTGSGDTPETCQNWYDCQWGMWCSIPPYGWGVAFTSGFEGCDPPYGITLSCGYYTQYSLNYSNITTTCTPDPGNDPPQPPGTGDPGGPADPPTPCETMQALGASQLFQNAYNEAVLKLNNPPKNTNNEPLEFGYTYVDPNNAGSYVSTIGDVHHINMNVAGLPIAGAIHTHPAGLGSLPIFSPADIHSIYENWSAGQIDPTAYTYTVLISNGQSYSLKITDIIAFNDFVLNYFGSANSYAKFLQTYYDENAGGIGAPGNSVANTETLFLNMLSSSNSGLSLFKRESNGTWPLLTLNSNQTPTTVPCP